MIHNTHEGLHYMPNHSSRVLKQVLRRENHETLDQTQIWCISLLKAPSSNKIQLNTHIIHVGLTTDNALRVLI